MVITKKEQSQFCFKNILNLCSINILSNALHLVSERYFNSYFYNKLKSYGMCNGSKSKVFFNIVVGSINYGSMVHMLWM
jgi:hypothetical protein